MRANPASAHVIASHRIASGASRNAGHRQVQYKQAHRHTQCRQANSANRYKCKRANSPNRYCTLHTVRRRCVRRVCRVRRVPNAIPTTVVHSSRRAPTPTWGCCYAQHVPAQAHRQLAFAKIARTWPGELRETPRPRGYHGSKHSSPSSSAVLTVNRRPCVKLMSTVSVLQLPHCFFNAAPAVLLP
jgi:hypothetical protein